VAERLFADCFLSPIAEDGPLSTEVPVIPFQLGDDLYPAATKAQAVSDLSDREQAGSADDSAVVWPGGVHDDGNFEALHVVDHSQRELLLGLPQG